MHASENVDIFWWDAGFVPHSCFALVKVNACHPAKTPRQLVVERLHFVGLAQNIDVVQESAELLTRFRSASNHFQSALNANVAGPLALRPRLSPF